MQFGIFPGELFIIKSTQPFFIGSDKVLEEYLTEKGTHTVYVQVFDTKGTDYCPIEQFTETFRKTTVDGIPIIKGDRVLIGKYKNYYIIGFDYLRAINYDDRYVISYCKTPIASLLFLAENFSKVIIDKKCNIYADGKLYKNLFVG